MSGMVAAGHPLTAEAGARVLRNGGGAVDAALAAMLVSWITEPLLTGPGAGGYLLVAGPGEDPVLLDFFVEAPGRGREHRGRKPLRSVDVSFGDAIQRFRVGASSCGAYGNPAGIAEAHRRWGTVPLDELARPAAQMAREGVPLNEAQAYVFEILGPIITCTEPAAARFAPGGRPLCAGELFRDEELAATIERLALEGDEPFYRGDIAEQVLRCLQQGGGLVTAEDLRRYRAIPRRPLEVRYRGRTVLTNPPPNAGGVLLAVALARLDEAPGPPSLRAILAAMEAAQAERTPEFTVGLSDAGFVERFLRRHLGGTTHISVLDRDGVAASVTCTNGEGSGMIVPGTGIHLNNIMGEEDLSPLGFHRAAPGTRMPSMMAPTVVTGEGGVELVLGSAGSNRIRSALLQTIVGVLDHGLDAQRAIAAPRMHFEEGTVYAEPGVPVDELSGSGHAIVAFSGPNLFFGGAQAVERDPATGAVSGAGDPRRDGAARAA